MSMGSIPYQSKYELAGTLTPVPMNSVPATLPPVAPRNKLNVADGSVEVKREVDGGLENIKIKMPAVITTESASMRGMWPSR